MLSNTCRSIFNSRGVIHTNFMYLRKSRAEEGQSTEEVLAKHRAALEELADRLGLPVDGVYEEVASGEKLYARPEMLKLLERIRAGEVEAVLCRNSGVSLSE